MSVERDLSYLQSLLRELCALPQETEWVEFKQSNDDAPLIGEYISALANAAAGGAAGAVAERALSGFRPDPG